MFRASWVLLRDVTLPALARHRLRTCLTLVGVVIGTLVVVAIAVLNRTILTSFERTVATIAGDADLQISNGMTGVPEGLVETVSRVPGVARAAALVQGRLATEWGDLTVFGVDLFTDQLIRETQFPRRHVHIKDALVFANETDSLAVSLSFLERAHLGLGSVFDAVAPTGTTRLTVRGTLDPVGPAALFGGAVSLADLPTAQRLFDRNGLVDQIDIDLAADADHAIVTAELRNQIAGAGDVEPPRDRGQRLGSMLLGVQTILTLVSLFAVIVGAFIVYHTVETATAQRRREFALIRALGGRQRVVLTAIAVEALLYGIVGAAVGTLLGVGAARASLSLLTAGVSAIYGSVDASKLTVGVSDVCLAGGLGVLCALLASLGPALQAARMRILTQIRSDRFGEDAARPPLRTAVIGIGSALLGCGILASGLRPEGFSAKIALIMGGVVLTAVGYTLVAATFVRLAVAALRWVLPRNAASAALALENIGRDPAKSRGALGALMVAFAMVLIVAAFVQSLRGSILTWIDQTFSADLLVSPTAQLPLPAGPTLAGELAEELRTIPEVAVVAPSRMINVRLGDDMVVLRTETPERLARAHYPVVAGDIGEAHKGVLRGDTVLVSDNLAYRHGLHVGDTFPLETPSGRRDFRIGAIVLDYTLDVGTILLDHDTYRELWRDDLVSTFHLWLTPAGSLEGARSAIAKALQPRYQISIITNREFSRQISDALDNALVMTNAIQLVAVAIALIGVVNFFLAETLDRRREIGLLRSVAMNRGQLVGMFVTEALVLGALGGILAFLFAWPVARLLVTHSTRMVSGWSLAFAFPYGMVVVTVVVAALTSMVAAYYPGRRAAALRTATLVVIE